MNKKRTSMSTTQIIMLSFLAVILVGSLLLALPLSSADGKAVPYLDALFTSTTATCVTGLVTVPTVSSWSVFGQAVILVLIQIGGLGIITLISALLLSLNKTLGLKNRLLLQDAFNLSSISGLSRFLRRVLTGTFVVEGAGALLYMTVFVPKFGARGIWISVFNSVSAFCNAGIDIIAENSLIDYATNPVINIVTCLLIILGGLGFIVWWDVIRVLKMAKTHGIKCFRQLTLHSKLALSATAILIILGSVAILVFEWSNPATIKDLSLFDKIQISVFQSITTRTAGFATVPQESLSTASAVSCILLMFIGGSPVGTAGGVKTVTMAVIAAFAVSTVIGREKVSIFSRSIAKDALSKAIAVVTMSFSITFIATVLLAAVSDGSPLAILYECVSATATVGLSMNLTNTLNTAGKIIIIGAMYLGRIGPISLAFAFSVRKKRHNAITNPTENISVG